MTDRLAGVVDVARGSERGRWEAYTALMYACGKPEAGRSEMRASKAESGTVSGLASLLSSSELSPF